MLSSPAVNLPFTGINGIGYENNLYFCIYNGIQLIIYKYNQLLLTFLFMFSPLLTVKNGDNFYFILRYFINPPYSVK